ncbi:hypothetical protein MTR67_024240 [Solanum verrucosum]|uniref:Uncharacterized protein n=1 Tax=Solanum verrucosum TaxID=315347 RepID=A0AAF0R1A2_SOLVR|nr:hypothetical protein MTR67_024240 [Solanum verrucosum]
MQNLHRLKKKRRGFAAYLLQTLNVFPGENLFNTRSTTEKRTSFDMLKSWEELEEGDHKKIGGEGVARFSNGYWYKARELNERGGRLAERRRLKWILFLLVEFTRKKKKLRKGRIWGLFERSYSNIYKILESL